MEHRINAKGLQCPGPLLQLSNTAKTATSGDRITIEVSDQGFRKDVEKWCKKTGNQLISLEGEDLITAVIQKG